MKRIIHLSDLHVGYKNFDKRFQVIVTHLIFEKRDKASDYIILITGDLVDNAKNIKLYDKVKKELDNLRKAGFKHILVIPGNHDYGNGKNGNKKYVKLFKLAFYGKEISYPKLDIIDNLAFIGLDSMAEELHWYDKLWAQGELGDKQLSDLNNILNKEEVVSCAKRIIYMHHHPFHWIPFHQLKDSKKLKKTLLNASISIDAMLYGHNHEGGIHNGQWGISRCYEGGTATLKPRPKYMKLMPWSDIKSTIRVINIGDHDSRSDYEIKLI